MKKMTKRVFAIIMAVAMMAALAVTVSAVDATMTNTDVGKIIVKGVDANTGTNAVTIYKIVEPDYSGTGGLFVGYKLVSPLTTNDIADFMNPTPAELAAAKAKVSAVTGVTWTKSGNDLTSSNLPVGEYIVEVADNDAVSYNLAVASVSYKTESGKDVVDDGDVTMGTAVSDGVAWVKRQDEPNLDKAITQENGTNVTPTNGNSAKVGDILTYTVEVDPIPYYDGQYPKFVLTDTLSAGLTYVTGSLTVQSKNGEADAATVNAGKYTVTEPTNKVAADATATATAGGGSVVVDFVKVNDGAKTYGLNDVAGQKLILTYKVQVNTQAKLNELGNNNDVVLDYSKDSHKDGDNGKEEDKTYTYTFDIDGSLTGSGKENVIDSLRLLNKIGEEVSHQTFTGETKDVKAPLAEAEFTLYAADGTTQVDANTYTAAMDKVTSDSAGQLHMTGLKAGTYILKETKAPTGYALNTTQYKLVIEANYNNDGTLNNWVFKVGVGDATPTAVSTFTSTYNQTQAGTTIGVTRTEQLNKTDPAYYPTGVDILNTQTPELPSTGGIGTYVFTIAGVAIMAVAGGLLIIRRKKA